VKLHITVEQLNQLSEKGKEKIFKYWWDKQDEFDKYVENHAEGYFDDYKKFPSSKWFSIGQMIEFLKEHYYEDWDFIVNNTLDIYKDEYNHQKEIVDYLWEAVKEVLNE